MLARCGPIRDGSCMTLKTPSPVRLGRSSLKLKLRRGEVAPAIAPGRDSGKSNYCGWTVRERGHLSQQQGLGSLLSCRPRSRRSPYFGKGAALGFAIVSVLAQENRGAVKVAGIANSISLSVSLGVVTTTKPDVGLLGLTTSDMALYGRRQPIKESERYVTEDEMNRRRRISVANKGKVPWNKGTKHSPETIQRIRERTMQAMRSPSVQAKLRLNARHSQTQETKLKIREKLRVKWDLRRKVKGHQENMLKEWKDSVADAARRGGFGEEEMAWNSYFVIRKQMRLQAEATARSHKKVNKQKVKVNRPAKSEEHRKKISDAIRAKWEDPEYQSKVRQGMSRSPNFGEPNSNPVPRSRKSVRAATTERASVKQPLDQGFVNAVMSGEKTQPKSKRTAKKRDRGNPPRVTAVPKRGARYQTVDLLKKHCEQSRSASMDSSELEQTSAGYSSEGQDRSLIPSSNPSVDPRAAKKVATRKLFVDSCSHMDMKQQEAVRRAKCLMAEAERAIRVFEAIAAGNDESAQESLAEVQTLMTEAAQFIQAADSINKGVQNSTDLQSGEWGSVSTPHGPPDSQVQTESQVGPTSTYIDASNTSGSSSEAIQQDDCLQQRVQNATSCVDSSSSIISDCSQVVMPNSELRETAVWDAHHPFKENSAGSSTVSSLVHLLNGRASKSLESMMEAKGNAFSNYWQHRGLVAVEDEHAG